MSNDNVFAVVLAAGGSRRFGSTKQLAEVGGESLIARAARLAETACPARALVVAGADWRAVTAAARMQRGFFVVNPDFADGLGSSIRQGVRSIADVADAVLLVLADQPLVTTAHLRALIDRWREAPGVIVATGYAGTAGPPVIFPRRDFAALLALGGERGAKSVLHQERQRVRVISFEAAAVDIDRPADLRRLQRP